MKKNNFINENWNAFNVLLQNASSVGAIDLGFFEKDNSFNFFNKLKNNEFKLLYFVGSDNLDFVKSNEFIIYQGSHGDRMAQIADVIFPSPAYTEQNGLFINLEGRLQKSNKSTYPPGSSKEDWKIFNLILNNLKEDEKFKNFVELRTDTISKIKNHTDFDLLPKKTIQDLKFETGSFINEPIYVNEIDYYFSNSIARSSKTMSDCRAARSKKLNKITGS